MSAIHYRTEREARAFLASLAEPGDATLGYAARAVGAQPLAEIILGKGEATSPEVTEMYKRLRARLPHNRSFLEDFRRWSDEGYRYDVPTDEGYPSGVADLGDGAPLGLWRRGKAWSTDAAVGIVGARAATAYGEHVASELTSDLVAKGVTIVSGGAYGIDGAAHRAALASGGVTVAFMAGGVDRAYPIGHQSLFDRILDNGGTIYSETSPGSAPTKWRFLQRNRLIAAASAATVVVEAGSRSGSLNTIGHARSIARPVGAVPGPITSAASVGCHLAIREGAHVITNAADVRELLGL